LVGAKFRGPHAFEARDETYLALVRDTRLLVGLLKTGGLAADGLRRCDAASTLTELDRGATADQRG
jgi:hypothetical protein